MDEDITPDFCTADPDQILPAKKFSTHLRHEPVKLRLNGPEAEKPISVPTLLVKTVKKPGHGTALGEYKLSTCPSVFLLYFPKMGKAV